MNKKTQKYDDYISYLGKNKKGFLIVVNQKNDEIIEENNLTLLKNILKAGLLSLDDVMVVSTEQDGFSFLEICKQARPIYILAFGVDAKKLGVPHEFELYKPTKIKAITWIISHNFVALHSDKTKKLGLWTALKELECYVS